MLIYVDFMVLFTTIMPLSYHTKKFYPALICYCLKTFMYTYYIYNIKEWPLLFFFD